MGSYLYLSGGWVVTMAESGTIENGAVLVEDNRILLVGSVAKVEAEMKRWSIKADLVVDFNGKILLPGLIDAHTHQSQQTLPGLYERATVQRLMRQPGWANILMPYEAGLLQQQLRLGFMAAGVNAVRVGTTFLSEHGAHYPETLARAMSTIGIRGFVCLSTADMNQTGLPLPEKMVRPTEELKERNLAVVRTNWGPTLIGCLSLRQITVCTPELIKWTYRVAEEEGVQVQTHANEGHYETDFALKQSGGFRPIPYLESLGGLSSHTIAAHCVYVDRDEAKIMGRYRVNVAWCPRGNFSMGGKGQIPELMDQGCHIGLGSDGPASGTSDLFEAMRMARMGLDTHYGAPYQRRGVLSPKEVLRMATIDGAHVVGQADKIGSLEPGKLADMIIVKPGIGALPVVDPINTLVIACSGKDVEWVIVDGRVVMQKGVIKTVSEQEIYQQIATEVPTWQDEFLTKLKEGRAGE